MMQYKFPGLAGFCAAALSVSLLGCQGTGGFADAQERLAEIDQKQDAIIAKFAAIEEGIKEAKDAAAKAPPAAAKRPPQGPRPGRPDPAATYKVDVGDANFKGPADAKITLVEYSDFQ